MRPPRSLPATLLWGLALLALAPREAHAWTEASIRGADAHVDVLGERALVSLRLRVQVHGGWLSRLELAGLEPDLALDPEKPPTVVSADGNKVAPFAHVLGDGRVVLDFADKRTAPRRGQHDLTLVYEAALATHERARGGRKASWSLPAFRTDLTDVNIWVNAPRDSEPLAAADDEAGLESTRLIRGTRAFLHFHVARLPRSVPAQVEFSLGVTPSGDGQPRAATLPRAWPARTSFAMGALVLLLALVKRRVTRTLAVAHGARPRPVLPMGGRLRVALMVACAGAFAFAHADQPTVALCLLVALVTLALDAGFEPIARRHPATHAPIGAARTLALHRARRHRLGRLFGSRTWLDVTAPAGAVLLASAYALLFARITLGAAPGPWLEALVAATPLWLCGTRTQLPPTRHDAVVVRMRAARRLRALRTARHPTRASSRTPAATPTEESPAQGGAAPSAAARVSEATAATSRPAAEGRRAPDRAA